MVAAATHDLGARHPTLSRDGSALVHCRDATKPAVPPRIFSRAQFRAFRDQSVRARAARLVLSGGHDARDAAVDGDRNARPGGCGDRIGKRRARPPGEESVCEPRTLGRRLPRVSRPVDALPYRLLFPVALEATRLHPALDSTACHPDRRLPEPFAAGGAGAPAMAAGTACVAGRGYRNPGAATAVVHLPCGG